MQTITISTNDYDSYVSVAVADAYLVPSLGYATWSALTTDQKGAFLIQSTRFLDALNWKDAYDTQAEREAVQAILDACVEIASLFAQGSTSWIGGIVPEDATKRLKAGSAEIEYMARPWFAVKSINWPPYLLLLLTDYLAGNSSAVGLGISAQGTDGTAGDSLYNGDYGLGNP